jgi:hypothetical protein
VGSSKAASFRNAFLKRWSKGTTPSAPSARPPLLTQEGRPARTRYRNSETASLVLFAAVLLLYLSFPTQNYYWDGVFFAQIIEEDPGGLWYLHPNHLLYNPLGRLLWLGANAVGMNLRALTVLQILSSLAGAAAVAILFLILIELEISFYTALCISCAFAFSGTWWRFATDAASYVPSIFLMLVCVLLLAKRRPFSPLLSGLFHSGAMLMHQLAIFFYPAAVMAMWAQSAGQPHRERLKRVAAYTLAAALPTAAVYCLAFVAKNDHWTPVKFMAWVASYSPDASFSFSLGKNFVTSIAGHVKLVFSGNMRLVTEQRSVVSLVAAVALGATLLIVIRRFAQHRPKIATPPERLRRLFPSFVLWWVVYALFLLVWLPHNTFYRLFYLPALVLLAAGFIDGPKTRFNRLALCVAAVFLLNFGFSIYPQSRPGTNPGVEIAHQMRGVWKPGEVVYWDVYAADNRTIRYFSPEVEWRELWGRAYINLLEDSFAQFDGLWFDSAALAVFRGRDPEFAAWLSENIRIDESYEFPVGNHVIGFSKLAKRSR